MGSISFVVFSDILMGVWTSQVAQNPSADEGDGVLIPEWGRSPGEGNCNPPQTSCLKSPMDRGTWGAPVHGVTRVGQDLATEQQQWVPSWALFFA